MLLENIRKIIGEQCSSIDDFAEKIGDKTSRVNDVLRGKQRPPFDMIQRIVETFQLDANVLMFGKVPDWVPHADSESEFEFINVYDIEVSAGAGSSDWSDIQEQPVSKMAYRRDWLRSKGLSPKSLSVVIARGDSMTPKIEDKNALLINHDATEPKDGFIYVVRSGENRWVKRVQKLLDGSILLISENPLYPPMTLKKNSEADVQFIGRVEDISNEVR